MSRKKKKFWQSKKAVCLVLLAVAMLSFGTTWAYYNDIFSAANPFNTTHSGATIVEEYNPDSSFLPGETVTKEVKFANTGDMDLFLRVEVPSTEGWYIKNSGTPMKKDEDLDPDYVIKKWTKEVWVTDTVPDASDYVEDYDPDKTYTDDELEYELNRKKSDDSYYYETQETDQWTAAITDPDTGKSYRYYKKILKVEDTTDPILDEIKLSPLVSNDRHDYDYSDKIYRVTFNAEAVPVEATDGVLNNISVQSEWGMDAEVAGYEEDEDGNKITLLTWEPAESTSDSSAD